MGLNMVNSQLNMAMGRNMVNSQLNMAMGLNMVNSQLNMDMGLNMVQIVDNINLIKINSMDIHRSLVNILIIANIHHPHQTSRQAEATNSHLRTTKRSLPSQIYTTLIKQA